MGIEDFTIKFDNPWNTYYPGQIVSGTVVITLNSTKKIRGLSVKIKGEANTRWFSDKRELDNKGQYHDETEAVFAHEEYFNSKYYLVGSGSGGEIEIQAGEHKFPFTCALPPNLPSSFESDYGHVRYLVKATLDRPWRFDQETKIPFTVVAPYDLNQDPRVKEPVQSEMSKNFCCLCCGSRPLTVNYSLPVRGYVPGQTIPVKIDVDNQSGVTVETLKVILCKKVTLHVTTPRQESRTEEIIVAEIGKGPVQSNETADYQQLLEIPPLPPSNLQNCKIIDLEYVLKIKACVSEWYHRNLETEIPLFVGTIPLVTYQTPSAPPASMIDGYNKMGDSPTNPTSNLYPTLPPPSYEESTYNARNLREKGESEFVFGLDNRFAPRYPVYNFPPLQ